MLFQFNIFAYVSLHIYGVPKYPFISFIIASSPFSLFVFSTIVKLIGSLDLVIHPLIVQYFFYLSFSSYFLKISLVCLLLYYTLLSIWCSIHCTYIEDIGIIHFIIISFIWKPCKYMSISPHIVPYHFLIAWFHPVYYPLDAHWECRQKIL